MIPAKADARDRLGRFREIVSDPLNALIRRHPMAGVVSCGNVTLHNGLSVPVMGSDAYYGDFSEILVINRGVHEPLEEYVFQTLLDRLSSAPSMLELGSYWAHYSMWLKKERPNANVIMIDCDPFNLSVGQRNFVRNGLAGEFRQKTIEGRDFQLEHCGGSHFDVVHIDVQGAEVAALAGCVMALQDKRIRFLFVSTHSPDLHRSVRMVMNRYGYRIEADSDWEETTAYDGLVFAVRPDEKRLLPADFKPPTRQQIVERAAVANDR